MAVASFIEFCVQHNIAQPPDKIVKNLCTFLCQDVEQTPTFAFTRHTTKGILSFEAPTKGGDQRNAKEAPKETLSPEDAAKTRLSRRGAGLAFDQLSAKFGARLLDVIPAMWHSMSGGLLSACSTGMPLTPDMRL